MRTYNEKTQDTIEGFKRNIKRIYDKQIVPYVEFEYKSYERYHTDNIFTLSDTEKFFENHQSEIYETYKEFEKDLYECFDIYDHKIRSDKHDEYDKYDAKADYELFKKVGETCVKLTEWIKKFISARIMVVSREGINERRKDIDKRIEHAHEYPHNLRPPMSQGRLYGEKTCAPQRKRATPKKRAPAVKVNVRKMF